MTLPTPRSFRDHLRAVARANDSWLCVGLDPDVRLAPDVFRDQPADEWVPRVMGGIVEATADLVCCYKPNLAFYEALGPRGWEILLEVLRQVPDGIPIIADAKRGDIAHTARAYAEAIFDGLGCDAVTVSPYLGGDSLEPFFDYPDKGVFVLCKTSNPGSGDLQNLLLQGGDGLEPLYRVVARTALTWDRHGALGLVVGATYPEELASIRAVAPDVPILVPGVGPQAGDLEAAVRSGADARGEQVILNASRAVAYASHGSDWQEAGRAAAQRLRARINAARQRVGAGL